MTHGFTIVTPVYNGMPWLPEAVRSVAAQRQSSGFGLEHLVIDGGSDDGSREWLGANQDLGYIPIFEPDQGQTDALIKGFSRATGNILAWLNADDILECGALARVAATFEANPGAVLVSGVCLLIDSGGAIRSLIPTPPVASFEGLRLDQANPGQPATFVTAEAYRQVGGLDIRYDLAMDVDLWLKVAQMGRIVFLPDATLARFRVHASAKSVVGLTAAIREDFSIRRAHGMPLRSAAAVGLFSRGWLKPLFRPAKRSVKRALSAVVRRA